MFKYSLIFLILIPAAAQAHVAGTSYDPFYGKQSSIEHIKQHYSEGDLRVLIVPGHGKNDGGTQFADYYERDLNVLIAHKILKLLESDKNFKIYVARDETGQYASWFQAFMDEGHAEITAFRDASIKYYNSAKSATVATTQSVYHNTAPAQTAFELYALNKFANDNRIDIALHIHINDYPRSNMRVPGEHIGFTIYVPDSSFANGATSQALAIYLRDELSQVMPISTLPGEDLGVTPDRELIAIGSHGTRDNASLLIEYSYIYESQFASPEVRALYLDYLARQTAQALENFFGYLPSQAGLVTKSESSSFYFSKLLFRGMRGLPDILALQIRLNELGLYPPLGKTLRDCPMTGNFGPCTEQAVKSFQAKNYLEQVGMVGPKTRTLLNTI